MDNAVVLLFPLVILLHNIEEAIWLPAWSAYAGKYHKKVEAHQFYFAVMLVTLLAFLATALVVLFPETPFFKWVYYGFLAAMSINVLAPHLVATIALRRYAPGLLTGLFLMWPINGLIMFSAIRDDLLSPLELGLSAVGVGACLLVLLPLFFKAGKLVADYQ
jgi:hypothetical protein